jgi:hypothetical protein
MNLREYRVVNGGMRVNHPNERANRTDCGACVFYDSQRYNCIFGMGAHKFLI